MLMLPLNGGRTFHWMLPKLSPPSWSMTCPIRIVSSRLWVVSLGQPPKQGNESTPRVVACGECAPSLWAEGKADAAIRLEQLWDQIVSTYEVDTLCGYALSTFHDEEDEHVFQSICAEHSAVDSH
jgi:hypothetical protein